MALQGVKSPREGMGIAREEGPGPPRKGSGRWDTSPAGGKALRVGEEEDQAGRRVKEAFPRVWWDQLSSGC